MVLSRVPGSEAKRKGTQKLIVFDSLKTKQRGRAQFGHGLLLSPDVIRQVGIGPPAELVEPIHAEVEPDGSLQAAAAQDIHLNDAGLLVRRQARRTDRLRGPAWGHAGKQRSDLPVLYVHLVAGLAGHGGAVRMSPSSGLPPLKLLARPVGPGLPDVFFKSPMETTGALCVSILSAARMDIGSPNPGFSLCLTTRIVFFPRFEADNRNPSFAAEFFRTLPVIFIVF